MNLVEDRQRLVRHLIELGKTGLPDMAEDVFTMSTEAYTHLERFNDELEYLFRRQPTLLAFSGELPNPGDYRTFSLAGVPLILLRGGDGVVRCFRNSCVHRGSFVLTEERGCGIRRMTCPYHGWTYDDRGRLVGVPVREAFPGLDIEHEALMPVHVQELHGLIFVQIDGEPIDLERFLGPVGERFAPLRLEHWEVSETEWIPVDANWKIVIDSFAEAYHVPVLHRESLLSRTAGTALSYEPLGRHIRQCQVMKSLQDREGDPDSWNEIAGVDFAEVYMIHPNIDLTIEDRGVFDVWRVLPGNTVGESFLLHTTLYSPDLPSDDADAAKEKRAWARNVVVGEDMTQCARIWQSMDSGSLDTVRFGRNERSLHHWHTLHDEVIAKGRQAEPAL